MATGGLARGFLLKGGRQGIFTAGTTKLQVSAARTSEITEEQDSQELTPKEALSTTGVQPPRLGVKEAGVGRGLGAGSKLGGDSPQALYGKVQPVSCVDKDQGAAEARIETLALEPDTGVRQGAGGGCDKTGKTGGGEVGAGTGGGTTNLDGSSCCTSHIGGERVLGGVAVVAPSSSRGKSPGRREREASPGQQLRESEGLESTQQATHGPGEMNPGLLAASQGGEQNAPYVGTSNVAGHSGRRAVCEIDLVPDSTQPRIPATPGPRQAHDGTPFPQRDDPSDAQVQEKPPASFKLEGRQPVDDANSSLKKGGLSVKRASIPLPPPLLDQPLTAFPKSQPSLPPEMVSFLLGPFPTPGTGQAPEPLMSQPTPFDQTTPGWSAELSLASAVAQQDPSTRLLNLPTLALQSIFSQLPVSAILGCQLVSQSWRARFADDPKLWASIDLSEEHLRGVASDAGLVELLDRSRDRWGTSYLRSLDVTGCKNVSALGLMAVMKHRSSLRRLRSHGSGAQLPLYFAHWLAEAGVDAHVDVHTGQHFPRAGLSNVALSKSTWRDLVTMLAGSTPVTICGLDIRPSPLPFPGDLVIAFLRALFAAEHLHTLRVAWNFGDRELLHDIAHVLKARTAAGAEGLEVLALEGIRGRLTKNTWAAVFALLDGDRCRIRKVRVKDCNLGREGGAALAVQLSSNTSVTDLEIVNCGLDTKAWEELAAALQENRSVRKLTVGGWGWKEAKMETGPFEGPVELFPDDDGAAFVGRAIAGSSSLREVRIPAWCGPALLGATGQVVDCSPGFSSLLLEVEALDPGTSRLEKIVITYDDSFVEDRGQAGAFRIASMIQFMVGGTGIKVQVEVGAQEQAQVTPNVGRALEGFTTQNGAGRLSSKPHQNEWIIADSNNRTERVPSQDTWLHVLT